MNGKKNEKAVKNKFGDGLDHDRIASILGSTHTPCGRVGFGQPPSRETIGKIVKAGKSKKRPTKKRGKR